MAWTRKRTRGGRTVYLGCYRDPDGQERSQQFDDERAALRWAEDQEDEILAGGWMDPATRAITVAEWAPRWLRTKRGLAYRTRRDYRARLGLLPPLANGQPRADGRIGRRWGRWRLVDIHRDAVHAWVDELAAEGLGADYIKEHLKILHGMLREAELQGLIVANPVTGIEVPKARRVPGRWLDADGLDRLADAFEQLRPGFGRVWVLVVGYAGLRWSESVALRRRHVDLVGRRLEVYDAGVETDHGIEFEDAKTQGPVDLPAEVADLLAAHLATVPDDPEALVFTAPEGGPLWYGAFRRGKRGFDAAVTACGWKPRRAGGVTPHVLRHSAATILIASGAHPQLVRTHMRHASIRTTYDIYGHLFPGAVADVWDRIQATRRVGDVVDLEERRRRSGEEA